MPIAAGLDVIEDQATFERERKKLLIECVKIPMTGRCSGGP